MTRPSVFIVAILCVSASAEGVPGPVVDVRPVMSVPTFTVGDKPFVTPCFETYVPEQK
mgnify:CR=1 FL=1